MSGQPLRARALRYAPAILLPLALVSATATWSAARSPKGRSAVPTAAAAVAPASDASRSARQLSEAEARVKKDPEDPANYHRLAIAQMRVQRETGRADYYHQAEQALRKADHLAPGDYQTQKLLAWVLAGSHQFDDALKIARECARRQPGDYWNYGVIGDALTETGSYEEAVKAVQTMVDLRPGSTAYARAAHQRRLHGQPKGALKLFELALDATGPAEHEALAWLHTQMAEVAFEEGDLAATESHLEIALRLVPGYHLAAADRARLLAARGDLAEAAAAYEQVLQRVERPDWTAALGDVYLAMGDRPRAEQRYTAAERYLAARLDDPTADAGHALATLLADRARQPHRALELAREEIAAAQDIRAWDTYAWALYHQGRHAEAWKASRQALRLGTRDPKLLYHAGAIGTRLAAHRTEGQALLRRALDLNPHWHPLDAPAAKALLERVRADERVSSTPGA